MTAGNSAHQRPLAGVSVTTAAEQAPEFSTAALRLRLERLQRFFKRVWRVRVINHDQGCGFGRQRFHATRHWAQLGTHSRNRFQWQAKTAQSADHAQQIGDVEFTDDRGRHLENCLALKHFKS